MELTGFIAKVNLPSLGIKPVRYEEGALIIQGIPDRKYAILLLDCLEGLASARDKIVAEDKHDRDDQGVIQPPLALEPVQAGNSGEDIPPVQDVTPAQTAQTGDSPHDQVVIQPQTPQAVNSGDDMAPVAADVQQNTVSERPGLDPQTARDAYDAVEAGNSEPNLIGDHGVPEKISEATTLRPIITYLRNEEGLKSTEEIVARCEQLKEVVPYLHRTKNLGQRVPRTLAAIEAE